MTINQFALLILSHGLFACFRRRPTARCAAGLSRLGSHAIMKSFTHPGPRRDGKERRRRRGNREKVGKPEHDNGSAVFCPPTSPASSQLTPRSRTSISHKDKAFPRQEVKEEGVVSFLFLSDSQDRRSRSSWSEIHKSCCSRRWCKDWRTDVCSQSLAKSVFPSNFRLFLSPAVLRTGTERQFFDRRTE